VAGLRFFACVSGLLVACSSGTGTQPAGGDDGGDDGGSAGDDAPTTAHDSSSADTLFEAQPVDAGPDGDGAAPICQVADVSQFAPTWIPPTGPHAAKCTPTQISTLITACYDVNADEQTCGAWQADPANASCLPCWVGPVTGATWSPIVTIANPGKSSYLNFGGCVALADPTQLACGKSIQAAFECEMAACNANCPVPSSGSNPAIEALNKCFDDAATGGCTTFASAGNTCTSTLSSGGGPSAFCFQANVDNTALSQFLTLACGN
jgi:hypothetical protein